MPARKAKVTDDYPADEAKLSRLRLLAAEGFSRLDRGRGVALDDEKELTEFIRQIGGRAAAKSRNRRPRP